MKAISVIGLALLAGCYSEDKFADDFVEVMCNKMEECMPESLEAMGYADAAECIDASSDAEGESDDDCDFDKGAAKDCVDEYDALSCDDLMSGKTAESCSKVCG